MSTRRGLASAAWSIALNCHWKRAGYRNGRKSNRLSSVASWSVVGIISGAPFATEVLTGRIRFGVVGWRERRHLVAAGQMVRERDACEIKR